MSFNPESAKTETPKKLSGLKVLGLSCGSRNGNSEILLKEAIMGTMEHGVERAEIIRLLDLNIKPCTGCQTCVMGIRKGREPRCVIDDDVSFLLDKVLLEDCGLIVSAPVYFWAPPGILKVVLDRFPPYTMGKAELMYHPRRVGASISVGGSAPRWTPMGLTFMNHFLLPHRIIVDQFQVNNSGLHGQVIDDEKALQRGRKLGENVAASMKIPVEKVRFVGDKREVSCPKCHSNMLIVPQGLPEVVCPICDIKANISVKGDKMSVEWEDVSTSRHEYANIAKHFQDVQEVFQRYEAAKEKINKGIEKYKNLDIPILQPPSHKK